jgi:hypothetical protein
MLNPIDTDQEHVHYQVTIRLRIKRNIFDELPGSSIPGSHPSGSPDIRYSSTSAGRQGLEKESGVDFGKNIYPKSRHIIRIEITKVEPPPVKQRSENLLDGCPAIDRV